MRSFGRLLHVRRCSLEHDGTLGGGFAGIVLEEVRECTVRDTEIPFEAGKAIALTSPRQDGDSDSLSGSGTNSLVASNCLLLASQCIWMDLSRELSVELRLERSSFKGESFLSFVPAGTDELRVDARNNLCNPGIVVLDPRREGPAPLEHRMEWKGGTNLFCAVDYLLVVERRPARDIAHLEDWRTFWNEPEAGSRQANALFPANASGREAFQPADLQAVDGGPELPREQWRRFGADLEAVGPDALRAAHP